MTDAYSTEEEAPPDAIEPGEQDEGGEQTKTSQQEANYREGNPQRSCGLCGHFDSKGHSCDVVEGDISPFGFSDLYLRQDNPFREGEKDSFKGGTKVPFAPYMGEDVTNIIRGGAPPAGLIIGSKRYGGES